MADLHRDVSVGDFLLCRLLLLGFKAVGFGDTNFRAVRGLL